MNKMAKYILTYFVKVASEIEHETHGNLTTIGPRFLLPVGNRGRECTFVVCLCTCGCTCVSRVDDLRNGRIKSCGCKKSESTARVHTKHGMSDSDVHKIWLGINQRCTNRKRKNYENYGGSGVTLHETWRSDYGEKGEGFQNFYSHIGPRPSRQHSIDRIDVNGNYEPGNVRWATREEQNRNQRSNHNLTYNGKTQCIAAWAEEVGISEQAIAYRIQNGWSVEEMLTIPVKTPRNSVRYKGEIKSYVDWGKVYGIHPDTIAYRIKSGWSIGDALATPVKKKKPSQHN